MVKKKSRITRPRHLLAIRARHVGCHLFSLGHVEQLAGVDVNSATERRALWDGFRHLFAGPSEALLDAVMDHCSTIVMRRLDAGELSLQPTRY
jgi:hypothetical protein